MGQTPKTANPTPYQFIFDLPPQIQNELKIQIANGATGTQLARWLKDDLKLLPDRKIESLARTLNRYIKKYKNEIIQSQPVIESKAHQVVEAMEVINEVADSDVDWDDILKVVVPELDSPEARQKYILDGMIHNYELNQRRIKLGLMREHQLQAPIPATESAMNLAGNQQNQIAQFMEKRNLLPKSGGPGVGFTVVEGLDELQKDVEQHVESTKIGLDSLKLLTKPDDENDDEEDDEFESLDD